MSALTARCAVFAASRGVVGVLVFALLVWLGAGGLRDAAAGPQGPEDVTAFSYEQYCDAKGCFTYDGAALKLVKRPVHLKRVYEDAARGDARARELVRAAAAMRAEGVSEATLYINNPNICPSCSTLLPRMLPPGSRLTVVTPSGSTTFVGVPP